MIRSVAGQFFCIVSCCTKTRVADPDLGALFGSGSGCFVRIRVSKKMVGSGAVFFLTVGSDFSGRYETDPDPATPGPK